MWHVWILINDNFCDMGIKIAVIFITGRKFAKKTILSHLESYAYFGYDLRDISLYISIDYEYQKSCFYDYLLPNKVSGMLSRVKYISLYDRCEIEREYNPERYYKSGHSLFSTNEYASLRNAALICASLDGNDYAVFIDDDEYPYVPIKQSDERLLWRAYDVLSPHIKSYAVDGADVTVGDYCGYLSPIPNWITRISYTSRESLGSSLSKVNEVLTPELFTADENFKTFSNKELPVKKEMIVGVKSGNMGISLHAFRAGKIPLFYNPPFSRGEDVFFYYSLGADVNVLGVSSFIFHDPFFLYAHMLSDKMYPNKKLDVPFNSWSVNRFLSTMVGWLRYAPLYVAIKSGSYKKSYEIIDKIYLELETPLRELSVLTNDRRYDKCREELKKYKKRVLKDLSDIRLMQEHWKNCVLYRLKEKSSVMCS